MGTSFFYQREIEVLVSDLSIKNLKIEIDIKKDTKESPSTGTVSIWNLSESNETKIHDTARSILVSAGYKDFIGVIFNGTVQEVQRERTDLGRVTKISISSNHNAKDSLGGVTNRTFEKFKLADIIKFLVSFDLTPVGTYILGNTSAIPNEILPIYSFTGPTKIALTSLLQPRAITWYEDDGIIQFSKKGFPQPGSEIIIVTPNTGLIGSPTATDNGIRIRTFLNPRMQIGGIIRLESRDYMNDFKIISLLYKGTNWDGGFYTESEIEEITNQDIV